MDIAEILSQLEAQREAIQDAIDALERQSRGKPPESGGPPPNSGGTPPNAGGAAQLAGIGSTRPRRETRREPS